MDKMKFLEKDILEMKADTFSKYGKKIEMADDMLHQRNRLKARLEKILDRLKNTTVIKKGFRRKKRQQELLERVEGELLQAEKEIKKLKELKAGYIEDFKFQREANGLLDHSFIDEFYSDK